MKWDIAIAVMLHPYTLELANIARPGNEDTMTQATCGIASQFV